MAEQAFVTVSHEGKEVAKLEPQKRVYQVQKMPMTEAAIDAGLFRDLFVAIGEPLGDQGRMESADLLQIIHPLDMAGRGIYGGRWFVCGL